MTTSEKRRRYLAVIGKIDEGVRDELCAAAMLAGLTIDAELSAGTPDVVVAVLTGRRHLDVDVLTAANLLADKVPVVAMLPRHGQIEASDLRAAGCAASWRVGATIDALVLTLIGAAKLVRVPILPN